MSTADGRDRLEQAAHDKMQQLQAPRPPRPAAVREEPFDALTAAAVGRLASMTARPPRQAPLPPVGVYTGTKLGSR